MKWLHKYKRKMMLIIVYIFIFFLTIIVITYWLVYTTSKDKIFYNSDEISANNVALLLGTAKYVVGGGENQYYSYRICATIQLYKAGKIKKIILSGDNSILEYNEPEEMKKSLIKEGIPEKDLVLDYAGFRTFDSVVRAKLVFKQNKITIISQPFHLERAIYIAQNNDIQAIGYAAADIDLWEYKIKMQLREAFARVATMLDCYVLNTSPKFLGPEIQININ